MKKTFVVAITLVLVLILTTGTRATDRLSEIEIRLDEFNTEVALRCQENDILTQWSKVLIKHLDRIFAFTLDSEDVGHKTLEIADLGAPSGTVLYWAVAWDSEGSIRASSMNEDGQLVWPLDPFLEGSQEITENVSSMAPGEIREFTVNCIMPDGVLRYLVLATPDIDGLAELKEEYMRLYDEAVQLGQQMLATAYSEYDRTAGYVISHDYMWWGLEVFQTLSERAERYYDQGDSTTQAERLLRESIAEYRTAAEQKPACGFGESSWTDKRLGEFLLAEDRLERNADRFPVEWGKALSGDPTLAEVFK